MKTVLEITEISNISVWKTFVILIVFKNRIFAKIEENKVTDLSLCMSCTTPVQKTFTSWIWV